MRKQEEEGKGAVVVAEVALLVPRVGEIPGHA